MTVIHDFQERLNRSHSYADAPWWLEIYRAAFPDMEAAVSVRNDGWAQRAGIDRLITCRSGRTITIDEKVREKDWDDILLERWSDEERRISGWIQKPLVCEFIAYAFVPSRTCYLLPTLILQRAWRLHGREWISSCQEVRAHNKNYCTLSVAVPIGQLLAAISDAVRIQWSPNDYDADADFSESLNECYRVIRERKANGGPGWCPK